ncbi:hypothetical protein MRX96_023101 [Rhipicephalus microplus]
MPRRMRGEIEAVAWEEDKSESGVVGQRAPCRRHVVSPASLYSARGGGVRPTWRCSLVSLYGCSMLSRCSRQAEVERRTTTVEVARAFVLPNSQEEPLSAGFVASAATTCCSFRRSLGAALQRRDFACIPYPTHLAVTHSRDLAQRPVSAGWIVACVLDPARDIFKSHTRPSCLTGRGAPLRRRLPGSSKVGGVIVTVVRPAVDRLAVLFETR